MQSFSAFQDITSISISGMAPVHLMHSLRKKIARSTSVGSCIAFHNNRRTKETITTPPSDFDISGVPEKCTGFVLPVAPLFSNVESLSLMPKYSQLPGHLLHCNWTCHMSMTECIATDSITTGSYTKIVGLH